MGGTQCRLSILRNDDVPCCYFQIFPVDFEIVQCRLSILRNDNVPFRYFSNVPVDFKVVQCRLSNLRKRHVALSILRVKGPSKCMVATGPVTLLRSGITHTSARGLPCMSSYLRAVTCCPGVQTVQTVKGGDGIWEAGRQGSTEV